MRARSWFRALGIRHKLLALVLLPLLVVLPLLGVVLLLWGSQALDQLLVTKVRSDLAVANGYFERVLGEVGASTVAVADSQALHEVLGFAPATVAPHPAAAAAAPPAIVAAVLERFRTRERLDFINLRDADGRVIATEMGPVRTADAAGFGNVAIGQATTAIEVLQPSQAALLSPALRARVEVPLVQTRNAAPTASAAETRAMVLVSTQPVRTPQGRLIGHVQAGVLLNRNLALIDHINDIVYPAGSLPFGSRGTATLFLDDVRISTNVRLFGGVGADRAIGTRVSQAVRNEVLGSGRTWLDRAFVVDQWYVSGYQPLADGQGRRVGMLYVGFTEQPFVWMKLGVLAAIGVVFFAVMIGAAAVSLRWARAIFAPVERMAHTMDRVEAGELHARVGALDSYDELGALAAHLDRLLDAVDTQTRALQRWNAELDAKVAARTRELETAQGHLVRAEKLAAIGQLTAGIAHEVNNPIAVIQGNLDLMRELLGADAGRVAAELGLLDEQVERMRRVVTQLLQFARPNEYAGYVEAVDCTRLVEDCLVLANHQLSRSRIEVRRALGAQLQPAANRHELQQVLVNLLVNAIHAMPEGGVLSLSTRDHPGCVTSQTSPDTPPPGPMVEIRVEDTGPGLGPELLAELFQPFVTRKKDGTGLGLWISRSIVERYGGDLRAADRDDGVRGARFSVWLRA
jgi:two-component system NtrC family sensor kinase